MTTTTRPHDHTHNDHTHNRRLTHAQVLGKRAGEKRAWADKYLLAHSNNAEIWLDAWENKRLHDVWRMPDPYEGVSAEVLLLLNMLSVQIRDEYERAYVRTYIERMTQYANVWSAP